MLYSPSCSPRPNSRSLAGVARRVRRFLEEEPAKVHAPERPLQRRPGPVSTTRSTTRRAGPNRAPRAPLLARTRPAASAAWEPESDRARQSGVTASPFATTTALDQLCRAAWGPLADARRPPSACGGRPRSRGGYVAFCRLITLSHRADGRDGRAGRHRPSWGGRQTRTARPSPCGAGHDTIRDAACRPNSRTRYRRAPRAVRLATAQRSQTPSDGRARKGLARWRSTMRSTTRRPPFVGSTTRQTASLTAERGKPVGLANRRETDR